MITISRSVVTPRPTAAGRAEPRHIELCSCGCHREKREPVAPPLPAPPPWIPPPMFDARQGCPSCGVRELGVRVFNPGLKTLAEHTVGYRSVRPHSGKPKCKASGLNIAAGVR